MVFSERTGSDGDVIIAELEVGTHQLGILQDKEFYIDLEIDST